MKNQEFIKLSMAKELLKIRKEIENNEQHTGNQFNLVEAAYQELLGKQGHQPIKYKKSCSGCINQMNKMLTNWFKSYDESPVIIDLKPTGSNPVHNDGNLIPKNSRRIELEKMSYIDLKDKLIKSTSEDFVNSLNGNHPPKKVQIIDELMKPTS